MVEFQGEEEGVHAGSEGWAKGEGVKRVTVTFDEGVPDDVQAKCLFDFERQLRVLSGLDVRVFKDRMADDSRLRVVTDMTRRGELVVKKGSVMGKTVP